MFIWKSMLQSQKWIQNILIFYTISFSTFYSIIPFHLEYWKGRTLLKFKYLFAKPFTTRVEHFIVFHYVDNRYNYSKTKSFWLCISYTDKKVWIKFIKVIGFHDWSLQTVLDLAKFFFASTMHSKVCLKST